MKFFVAFVATLACAFAAPSYAPYGPYYGAPAYSAGYAHAPPADIKVLPSGYLADTPEVAHAKAAHLAEKAKVASKAAYYAPAPYAAPAYAPYAAPAYAPYAAPYHGSHY
uniref:Cuticle protein n=1 Tax=Cacopsylla melanoneura TaxID=428564 RepID=A0A8D8XLQ3_9HEMI